MKAHQDKMTKYRALYKGIFTATTKTDKARIELIKTYRLKRTDKGLYLDV